jgi:hypothetical protein
MKHAFNVVALVAVTALTAAPAHAEPRGIAAEPASFDLSGAGTASFETRAGRSAICVEGAALLEGVRARQGVLRADILNTGRRAFANLIFHAETARDFEAAYLRLHRSGQPDAAQYTPHISGESHWQLLGDAQVSAAFGDSDWISLEVAFTDDRAQVRIGPDAEMQVGDLRLNGSGDQLGLNSLFGACYSNISFDSAPPDLGDTSPPSPAADGVIERWSVSQADAFSGFPRLPDPQGAWRTVESEPDGFVYFARHTQRAASGAFEANPEVIVYAALEITSEQAMRVPLQVDASDQAKIWLNGQPVAEFDNSFRRKGALFRGDVDPTAQTLYLALETGPNTLVIGVAERANGWGLAAALPERAGLTVTPASP